MLSLIWQATFLVSRERNKTSRIVINELTKMRTIPKKGPEHEQVPFYFWLIRCIMFLGLYKLQIIEKNKE